MSRKFTFCLKLLNCLLMRKLQVSPELYGDNYPRFFTYWTVCIQTIHTHRKIQSYTVTKGRNTNGIVFNRRMRIKQRDVIIYCVRVLSKSTIRLLSEQQYLRGLPTPASNLILALWFGRYVFKHITFVFAVFLNEWKLSSCSLRLSENRVLS